MNLSLMLPELTALTVLGVLTLGEMYVKDFSQKHFLSYLIYIFFNIVFIMIIKTLA